MFLQICIGSIIPTEQSADQSITPPPTTKGSVSSWTESKVQAWLKESNLDDLCGNLETLQGKHLLEMYDDLREDHKTFKGEMKSKDGFQMNAIMYLKFKVALRELCVGQSDSI